MSVDAEAETSGSPASFAAARATNVFPVPAGPKSRIERGGLRLPVKRSGLSAGLMSAS